MDYYFEYDTFVRASESGIYYQCRPSGVLEMLQEAATQAAEDIHLSGPETAARYGAIWMIARGAYRLNRPLMWNERVTIRTWHRGDKGPILYRDFSIFADGRPAGEAVTAWVLTDIESRKLLRMSAVAESEGTDGGTLRRSWKPGKIRLPDGMEERERRRFGYSDTDANGHVNNVRYLDAAADALELEKRLDGKFVSQVQVGYSRECKPGETIALRTGQTAESLFVHGVDDEGVSRFEAALTLDNLPQGD